MRSLIVGGIETLSWILIAVLLLSGLLAGYAANGVIAGLVGLIISFVVAVLVFGALFILIEINESLKAIRKQLDRPTGAT